MKDKITKAILFGGFVSISVANTTDIVNKATDIHKLSPLAVEGLGRVLAITCILGSELKSDEDSLSVVIKGNGKLGNIVTSVDSKLNVRGLVGNPNLYEDLTLGEAVGKGYLQVLRKTNGQTYEGTCELENGEIAEDFAKYFAESEQQGSAVAVGILQSENGGCVSAAAILIRILPYCPDAYIDIIENKIKEIAKISTLLSTMSNEQFLQKYFGDYELEILCDYHPIYNCKCSRESIASMLKTLDKSELEQIIKEDGKITVECHFCNSKYEFYEVTDAT